MNPKAEKMHADLQERLRFETLLSGLSAQFVNLPGDQLDGVIEDAMRRVCDCLGLDLSTLWQWSPDDPYLLTLTHFYRPLGGPPPPEPMDAREHFPWVQAQLTAGREVLVESMDRLPPVWIGANFYAPQAHTANCMECRKRLRVPSWPADPESDNVLHANDLRPDYGLLCSRCGAVCCVACVAQYSRQDVRAEGARCPRCGRSPINTVFRP